MNFKKANAHCNICYTVFYNDLNRILIRNNQQIDHCSLSIINLNKWRGVDVQSSKAPQSYEHPLQSLEQ